MPTPGKPILPGYLKWLMLAALLAGATMGYLVNRGNGRSWDLMKKAMYSEGLKRS
jgi:hypothetical protein